MLAADDAGSPGRSSLALTAGDVTRGLGERSFEAAGAWCFIGAAVVG
jgi:hypothetical protein